MPEIKTVEGWITRYSASLRKEAAEQRVMDGSRDQESWVGTSKRPENGSKNTLPRNKRQKKQ